MPTSKNAQNPPRAVVRIGPSWIQVVALAIAVAFVSSAMVYYLENRTEAPNAADIGFIDDMNLHHQQAISMSFAYARRAQGGQIRNTAEEIITNQAGDLRTMGQLRGNWDEGDGNEAGTVMAWMGMQRPLQEMPGFASESDVAKLATLQGRALDDHFTTLMIRHHLGGIHMAEAGAQRAGIAKVKAFARGIALLQDQEIEEINIWRASANLERITSL